jgi:hypothetical protein
VEDISFFTFTDTLPLVPRISTTPSCPTVVDSTASSYTPSSSIPSPFHESPPSSTLPPSPLSHDSPPSSSISSTSSSPHSVIPLCPAFPFYYYTRHLRTMEESIDVTSTYGVPPQSTYGLRPRPHPHPNVISLVVMVSLLSLR